ncbi:ethanolaminephosphotransferase 1-like isoform X1 [Pectinophora gossypiella]|uniref:ethanolaminephosphotransferase 1-like isoform X1 n=1 Tax=Pectinophora gossypiella TaxID=13191 RepID=UPI00214E0E0D|nr:ethanolaminephosphotransferase 1-like isoform X1 [Pectinophora gossypiella]
MLGFVSKVFKYKYLSKQDLKGFSKYKYSAIDTSPLSQYLMHPSWNTAVKFIPDSIAPNLITFVGFLFMVADVAVLTWLDYDGTGSNVPGWVFTMCGTLLFLAYNLDGIDGKQARKIGVSGPLGEMFDHGLDSYVVFFIPYCLASIFGRDEFSLPPLRGFLVIMSITLNFYVSHCEKYNTGTLYLPWGYDLSMWVSSILFVIAGECGTDAFKFYVIGDVTFIQVFEVVIHATGFLTTLPIAVYNVYLSYKARTGKLYPLLEALRPAWSMLMLIVAITTWAVWSPNNVLEYDMKAFLLLYGTLFSHISSRLIVCEMNGQRCSVFCPVAWPLLVGVAISLYHPQLELSVLYSLLGASLLAHVHYGVCIVRQLCEHSNVSCFTVPKAKTK